MQSRSEWKTGEHGERIESGVIVHDGLEFVSGGSFLSPSHAIGYISAQREIKGAPVTILTWDGQTMGHGTIRAIWRNPRGWLSGIQMQVVAKIDGNWYTGRGGGNGMVWK